MRSRSVIGGGRYHTVQTRENRRSVRGLPFCKASRTNAGAPQSPPAGGSPSLAVNPAAHHFGVDADVYLAAYAQGTGLMDQSALIQFLPLVLIFVVFYFLLIRPQQQKQKDHKSMIEALRRGDRIVTGGGVLGTVSKVVSPEEVEVDIASGVRVRVLRSTISNVLAKPDPAAAREAAREKDREAAKADKV
jgi:preprotein translocase subunit YajC